MTSKCEGSGWFNNNNKKSQAGNRLCESSTQAMWPCPNNTPLTKTVSMIMTMASFTRYSVCKWSNRYPPYPPMDFIFQSSQSTSNIRNTFTNTSPLSKAA